jgi:hypothetical protein
VGSPPTHVDHDGREAGQQLAPLTSAIEASSSMPVAKLGSGF